MSFCCPFAVIASPRPTLTNLLWVKLVNRPGAKTKKVKSFPDLGCEAWQQYGTVPPQHFWRQWCHVCDLNPTHCKVPPGPQAGDFSPQLGCKNITTFHKCSPSRPVSQIGTIKMLMFRAVLVAGYNSLSCHIFCFSGLISAHKYNKEKKNLYSFRKGKSTRSWVFGNTQHNKNKVK